MKAPHTKNLDFKIWRDRGKNFLYEESILSGLYVENSRRTKLVTQRVNTQPRALTSRDKQLLLITTWIEFSRSLSISIWRHVTCCYKYFFFCISWQWFFCILNFHRAYRIQQLSKFNSTNFFSAYRRVIIFYNGSTSENSIFKTEPIYMVYFNLFL